MDAENLELKIMSEILNEEIVFLDIVQVGKEVAYIAFAKHYFFQVSPDLSRIDVKFKYDEISNVYVSIVKKNFLVINFLHTRRLGIPESLLIYTTVKFNFIDSLKILYKSNSISQKRELIELPLFEKDIEVPPSFALSSDYQNVTYPQISDYLGKESKYQIIPYQGYNFMILKSFQTQLSISNNCWGDGDEEANNYFHYQVSTKYSFLSKKSLGPLLNIEAHAYEWITQKLSGHSKNVWLIKSEAYSKRINSSPTQDFSQWEGWFIYVLYLPRDLPVDVEITSKSYHHFYLTFFRRKYIPPSMNYWQDIVFCANTQNADFDEWHFKYLSDNISLSDNSVNKYDAIIAQFVNSLLCDEEDFQYFQDVLGIFPSIDGEINPLVDSFWDYVGSKGSGDGNEDAGKAVKTLVLKNFLEDFNESLAGQKEHYYFELYRYLVFKLSGNSVKGFNLESLFKYFASYSEKEIEQKRFVKGILLHLLFMTEDTKNHDTIFGSLKAFVTHYKYEAQEYICYNKVILCYMIKTGYLYTLLNDMSEQQISSINLSSIFNLILESEFIDFELKESVLEYLVMLDIEVNRATIKDIFDKEESFKSLLLTMSRYLELGKDLILQKRILTAFYSLCNNTPAIRLYLINDAKLLTKLKSSIHENFFKDMHLWQYLIQTLKVLSKSAQTKESIFYEFHEELRKIITDQNIFIPGKIDSTYFIHDYLFKEYYKTTRNVIQLLYSLFERYDCRHSFFSYPYYEEVEEAWCKLLVEESIIKENDEEEEDKPVVVGEKDQPEAKRVFQNIENVFLNKNETEKLHQLYLLQVEILSLIRKSICDGDMPSSSLFKNPKKILNILKDMLEKLLYNSKAHIKMLDHILAIMYAFFKRELETYRDVLYKKKKSKKHFFNKILMKYQGIDAKILTKIEYLQLFVNDFTRLHNTQINLQTYSLIFLIYLILYKLQIIIPILNQWFQQNLFYLFFFKNLAQCCQNQTYIFIFISKFFLFKHTLFESFIYNDHILLLIKILLSWQHAKLNSKFFDFFP